MIQTARICDQCKQPIDPAKGRVSFEPLRGGLTLVVDNGTGNAGKLINQPVDLCDVECLGDYVKALAKTIKAPAAAATPVATATAATAAPAAA
jgi:hypothetical protein